MGTGWTTRQQPDVVVGERVNVCRGDRGRVWSLGTSERAKDDY